MSHLYRFITLMLFGSLLSSFAFGQGSSTPVDEEETYMRSIKVTRWSDPDLRPDTYQEYLRNREKAGYGLDAPFTTKRSYQSPWEIYEDGRRLDILIDVNLHEGLQKTIDEYIRDIETEGWAVTYWLCEGGTPPEVRAFLQKRYTEESIVGCVMIGELPVAWYEMDDDFNNRHSEFPTELYYMDLNGTFEDKDNDGKFDNHLASSTGDQRPEIFVGRLKPKPLTGTWGTEETLLQNYFRKVHDYRTGVLTAQEKALSFVDDDWYTMNVYQDLAYATEVEVRDKATTIASNYKLRLDESYESVVVCAHSSYASHSFKLPGGNGGRYSNDDLWTQDPPCLFYNLFACSNARYTSTRNMGSTYMFNTRSGLIAVGTTKTGSMLTFSDYYAPLGQQEHFGEAFRYWFEKRYPYSLSDRRWFYGMCILGDPTLRIDRAHLGATSKTLPSKGIQVDFSIDGRPDNAGQIYVILSSLSGSTPGTSYPGVRIPINWDLMSWLLVFAVNSTIFPDSMGNLDKDGKATAQFIWDSEIPKELQGKEITFSALLINNNQSGFILSTPPAAVKLGPSTKP